MDRDLLVRIGDCLAMGLATFGLLLFLATTVYLPLLRAARALEADAAARGWADQAAEAAALAARIEATIRFDRRLGRLVLAAGLAALVILRCFAAAS